MPNRYRHPGSQGGRSSGFYNPRQGSTPRDSSGYSGNPYRPQFGSASRSAGLPDQSQQVLCDIYGRPLPNNPSYDVPAVAQERPDPDSYRQYDGSNSSRHPQGLSYNSDWPQPQGPARAYTGGNANIETPLGSPPPYSQFDPSLTAVTACECGVESCNFPQTRAAMVTGNPGGLALFDKLMTCHLKNAESKKTQERLFRRYIARHPAPSAS